MVLRMELTYTQIGFTFDMKDTATAAIGYTLPPSIYEVSDINLMSKCLLPDEVEVNITFDDIRLRSNLTNNKKIEFFWKIFFILY